MRFLPTPPDPFRLRFLPSRLTRDPHAVLPLLSGSPECPVSAGGSNELSPPLAWFVVTPCAWFLPPTLRDWHNNL